MISSKEIRIVSLLVLDTIFFLLEVVIGYAVNSLALIADSFHMLNDIIALLVALWAVNVAKNKAANSKYTYGWQRAEILGALVNAVFLLALCFTIFIEAIQRFIIPQAISNAKLILIVGFAGLVSNGVGLILFHEHGHDHVSDSSAESQHGHSHGVASVDEELHTGMVQDEERNNLLASTSSPYSSRARRSIYSLEDDNIDSILPNNVVSEIERATFQEQTLSRSKDKKNIKRKQQKPKSLNVQGIFLHVLGDALGNVGVIVTALIIWKTDYRWRFYADPVVSLLITGIIFSSALPLCKSASKILLQATPTAIEFEEVLEQILNVPGVESVHDFHIWNLTERLYIASLHVEINRNPEEFLSIAKEIKSSLHEFGIHSVTIQPEFVKYYAQQNKLPQRFSSTTILANEESNVNGNDTAPLSNVQGAQQQYGSVSDPDCNCMVDATIGCDADKCLQIETAK
ncbi:BA75_04373T0 [Komagataella pastoris]|uniref:BA75_04373T0 n=1 Tax=Komagataella pastoris TaxID=4922 RepID=A0A1B2JHG1_PICPA|nr:BA75_04373T0 [Komagataella pastoris]